MQRSARMRLPALMLLICLISLASSFDTESSHNPRFKRNNPRETPKRPQSPRSTTIPSASSQSIPHESPKRGGTRTLPLTSTQSSLHSNPQHAQPHQARTHPRITSKSPPANSTVRPPPQWMKSGKFQGDIAGFRTPAEFDRFVVQVDAYYDRMRSIGSRDGYVDSAIKDPRRLWSRGVVPYRISHNSSEMIKAIQAAIRDFHEHTCIRFVERTIEASYVDIIADPYDCWSFVGRVNESAPQKLSLGIGCWLKSTAIHELMHAVGFWHEHQRIDRDQYVEVHEEYIESPCLEHNYKKADCDQMNLIGSYDIHSVMHYPLMVHCTKDGRLPMTPRDARVTTMGNTDGMTTQDIWKINKLYNCPAPTPTNTGKCPSETTYYTTDSYGNRFDICAIVYDQQGCNGHKYAIEMGKTSLDLSEISVVSRANWIWDDKIASIELNPNCKITLCVDKHLLGRNHTYDGGNFGNNIREVEEWLQGKISSLYCMCES